MAKNTFRKIKPTETNQPTSLKVERKKSVFKANGLISKIKKIVIRAVYYFLIVSIGGVVLFKFVPIPFTWTMLSEKIDSVAEGRDSEINYSWKSYKNISKEMPLAAVAAEDQLFPDHFGVDFSAMVNAYKYNLKGKKVRGASTISQQTAKNVFLWQDRSYLRKILEVYFTVLIEIIWGKERILEVYINVAEMGKNTFGVEAASKKYFGKSAINISRNEAAKLAAILPSPKKWSVTNPGPYVNRRVPKIMNQMRALGGVSYLSGLRSF